MLLRIYSLNYEDEGIDILRYFNLNAVHTFWIYKLYAILQSTITSRDLSLDLY